MYSIPLLYANYFRQCTFRLSINTRSSVETFCHEFDVLVLDYGLCERLQLVLIHVSYSWNGLYSLPSMELQTRRAEWVDDVESWFNFSFSPLIRASSVSIFTWFFIHSEDLICEKCCHSTSRRHSNNGIMVNFQMSSSGVNLRWGKLWKKSSSAHRVLLSLEENIDTSLSFLAHKDEIKSRRVTKQQQNDIRRARIKYLFNNLADDDRIGEKKLSLASNISRFSKVLASSHLLAVVDFFLAVDKFFWTRKFNLIEWLSLSPSWLPLNGRSQQRIMFNEIFSNFRLTTNCIKVNRCCCSHLIVNRDDVNIVYEVVEFRQELALSILPWQRWNENLFSAAVHGSSESESARIYAVS